MNPKHMRGIEQDFGSLAKALNIPVSKIRKKLASNANRGFVYLRRHLSPAKAREIMALGLKGVYSEQEYKRYYPAAEVASHLVGFTNIDDRGQEGMELAFDEWLRGNDGSKRVLKDLHGSVIRDIGHQKEAVSGNELSLSIDMRLQYMAYRELKAMLQKSKAKAGSVVVIDSHTGEVLAMVNQPSYNPNNRSQLNPADMRNRAMTDVFEPGSTVKPFTILAALESGKYQPHTLVNTSPGYIRVGKKTLLDPVNYGVIDVTKILTKSSQVGTSKIALDLDQQNIWEMFGRFGLGRDSGTGFPGESAGSLPSRVKWRPIERVNFAFGYGLSVTPVQLAQAYSVLANGGLLKPVSLLRKDQQDPGVRVVDAKQAQQIVAMLKTVTEKGGTGTSAQIASYTVAGKTGTVHKSAKGGYADDRYRAIFAGMAPATNPRLVTVVMIDEPGIEMYHGGEAAAPLFAKVMSDALRLLDITPDKLSDLKEAVAGHIPSKESARDNKQSSSKVKGGRKSA
jgi:cell division protein FtsI (penicillin-binding protein 3)